MEITKVYYRHYRYCYDALRRYYLSGKMRSSWIPGTFGGVTECVAEINYGGNTFEVVASARCSSEDRFCYKTGRELAYYRLQLLLKHLSALETLVMEKI